MQRIACAAWCLLCSVLIPACGDDGRAIQDSRYRVIVTVNASLPAREGREVRITAEGETDRPWTGPPFWRVFCATSEEAFLTTPIRVEVREGDELLADVTLDRFACALSDEEGNAENLILTLDEDGTLHWRVGDDPAAGASCFLSAIACSTTELR